MRFHVPQFSRNVPLGAVGILVCAIGLCGCGAAGGGQASSPVTLKSLTVSPATSNVVAGGGQQFTVTGHYSDNSQRDLTETASWVSVQPTIATITKLGMAVGARPGQATITASSGTVSSSATLTVSDPTLVSLSLSPSTASIHKGETQQFTVTGTFNNQSTKDVNGTVVWATSTGAIAAINSDGLATARAVGTATITVTSGSVSETGTLTVTPPILTSLAIAPASSSLALGTNEQLAATGTFSDGSTKDLSSSVTWTSTKPAVAAVSSSGRATTWSVGTVKVSANSGDFSASGSIVVLPVAAVDYFSYANNVNAPDATLNLANTGMTGGDLCAMIYVFDSSQEMNECCGCTISKDGIRTLSVDTDLTSNTLTGVTLATGVIRMVAADAASNPTCNAGTVTPSGLIRPWMTHIQLPLPDTYEITEQESPMPTLNKSELSDLESDCAFIQKLGSGHGVCTCGVGD
jgi:uncharacterized protein YjdB